MKSRRIVQESVLPAANECPLRAKSIGNLQNCITASRPDPTRERVVLTIEVPDSAAPQTFPCPKELQHRADSSKYMSLIQYLISRLEKMNNERAYCEPDFRRYLTVREISVRLSIMAETQLLNGYQMEFALTGCVSRGSHGTRQSMSLISFSLNIQLAACCN